MMERNALIAALVLNDVSTNAGDDDWFVKSLLTDGCRGYSNMSDQELEEYAVQAGIDPETGEES